MTITIRRVSYAEGIEGVKPMLEKHWAEIAHLKSTVPLAVDWDAYKTLEARNMLLSIIAQDDDRTIGYAVLFVKRHIHYTTTVGAFGDVLYLHPEYRKGGTGLKLIAKAEDLARDMGARYVTWHFKPDHDLTPVFSKLGYSPFEVSVAKAV